MKNRYLIKSVGHISGPLKIEALPLEKGDAFDSYQSMNLYQLMIWP